jgi:ArsR family transcriptional regulator
LLPSLTRHFAKTIAVDNSPAMLELAKRRISDVSSNNVQLRLGDLERLPLYDGEVDLALAFLMLHHLADVPAALAEIRRVLRPGGQLLVVEIYPHQNEAFRVAMADRRPGLAPDLLAAMATEAGLRCSHALSLERRDRPAHELAPLPSIYAMRCIVPAAASAGPEGSAKISLPHNTSPDPGALNP